jgi:hypothetical protein
MYHSFAQFGLIRFGFILFYDPYDACSNLQLDVVHGSRAPQPESI